MSSFVGVLVSDQWLQSQFTQVELRTLKSKYVSERTQSGRVIVGNLPPIFKKLKAFSEFFTEDEIKAVLEESYQNMDDEIDFESFLRAHLNLQTRAAAKGGGSKSSSSFLKAATTTVHHAINESEKASYVAHINSYLAEDKFMKQFLPIDPATNALFDLAKDGVLLCKLINIAVPGTIDERAINTKRDLNPWERNENHTLGLNSAKAIGCTVVNIGTQDMVEGRPYLVLGLISQIIKIQLLADLNLKKTPQLLELVEDDKDVEELISLAPDKVLLKWMNFHLKKAGYEKQVTNFSSDVKDGEAYAYLLNALAPETAGPSALTISDPTERANMVLEQAERLDCKRYLTPKDIVEGSPNLNLAFVAQIFQHRNGLTVDTNKMSFAEMMTDDAQTSREERCFRLWINSLGIATYVNNVFEDVRNGWVLLEVLDKVSPGSVSWKQATKPPIKMPFRKVENCNQVIKIGKDLNFSLVNVAGNDIVQGNKKLLLAFLWQLMRFTMLQLLRNLRSHSQGKEITDADILNWANNKVKKAGRTSEMESFKDKNLSNGIFFLELLSAVEPRVVNWSLVTKGETDDDKKLNSTYIISVARKLGCSIFLLPEDIIEVNQKMILTLSASIMYWSLLNSEENSTPETSPVASPNPEPEEQCLSQQPPLNPASPNPNSDGFKSDYASPDSAESKFDSSSSCSKSTSAESKSSSDSEYWAEWAKFESLMFKLDSLNEVSRMRFVACLDINSLLRLMDFAPYKDLIPDDPSFKKLHYLHKSESSGRHASSLVLTDHCRPDLNLLVKLPLTGKVEVGSNSLSPFPYIKGPKAQLSIIDSRVGVILLRALKATEIGVTHDTPIVQKSFVCYICNPHLQRYHMVELPACPTYVFLDFFKLCVDNSLEAFNVLAIKKILKSRQHYLMSYSSKSQLWSNFGVIGVKHYDCTIQFGSGIYCNNCLFWPCPGEDNGLYFDLKKKTAFTFPMPRNNQTNTLLKCCSVNESAGHLFALVQSSTSSGGIDVFRMNENVSGWVKMYHINIDSIINCCSYLSSIINSCSYLGMEDADSIANCVVEQEDGLFVLLGFRDPSTSASQWVVHSLQDGSSFSLLELGSSNSFCEILQHQCSLFWIGV